MSATGHYVLSFVTSSEMEISPVTVTRSRPARSRFNREQAAARDTTADMVFFAESVILTLPGAPMAQCSSITLTDMNRGELQAQAIYSLLTVLHN